MAVIHNPSTFHLTIFGHVTRGRRLKPEPIEMLVKLLIFDLIRSLDLSRSVLGRCQTEQLRQTVRFNAGIATDPMDPRVLLQPQENRPMNFLKVAPTVFCMALLGT